MSKLVNKGTDYDNTPVWSMLANAIVAKAAEDYRAALAKPDPQKQAEIESFFTGTWIYMLTKLDGVSLMDAIKKEVLTYGYRKKTARFARRGRQKSKVALRADENPATENFTILLRDEDADTSSFGYRIRAGRVY